jgi:DNA mismatch repair ATPase MutS
MELLDSRDNVLMRVIGPPLLYGTQLAFAIEAWRAESGPDVRRWMDAVSEFEALSALAGYAYEHPRDPFPEVAGIEACFEAAGLGHPLLPEARCVRNDLKLGGELRLLIVSGSNMSGKSTLLRSAGIAGVMAMAGGTVRATSLRMGSLSVGASIRTNDSLQDGTSRFYAEITRLRKLVDLASGPRPLLFLIDELLNGTNSHDRQIGAEAVVRGLVERGAIGLVTTHDLALTQIATAMAPRGRNVHFEDHLEDGRITFDYIMRDGVVRKSNALELMRSVGLEI